MTRFDRQSGGVRVHHETIGQALAVMPERKYTGTYLDVAALLLGLPGGGLEAVHELLRRIAVNDLSGNRDAHLNNFGLLYPDRVTAELSPAYDVVAYAAFAAAAHPGEHAIHFISVEDTKKRRGKGDGSLTPDSVKTFCMLLGINPMPAVAVLRNTVRRAARTWPALIQKSELLPAQKARLIAAIRGAALMQSALRRNPALAPPWETD